MQRGAVERGNGGWRKPRRTRARAAPPPSSLSPIHDADAPTALRAQGEASLLAEDPWRDLDDFLEEVDPDHRASFGAALLEMTSGDDPKAQAQALAIVASCNQPFDLGPVIAQEAKLRKDLEAHLALLLSIGQRNEARGRPIVEAAR